MRSSHLCRNGKHAFNLTQNYTAAFFTQKPFHSVQRRNFTAVSKNHISPSAAAYDASRIRNIGIIAHIDAGKTTTTERMLYYSGYTRRLGDVDDGSTVTDFLPAERARGITIQAAAITFEWPTARHKTTADHSSPDETNQTLLRSETPHQVNLIDTPGHADFTFEVRRSLRVLDGAVCILDGVAGVEAQTEEVWRQAGQWQIPRIIFVNKLDRDGAAFGRTVRAVGSRLRGWPAVCQVPWWETGTDRFTGIGDVVRLQGLLYAEDGDGKQVRAYILEELEDSEPRLAEELKRARVALVELLSEHDDGLVEDFLTAQEDHLALTPKQILDSLRRVLLASHGRIIPILAGSSFRNIGVQPLLDTILDLLPSPSERPDPEIRLGAITGRLQSLLQGGMSSTAQTHHALKNKTKSTRCAPSQIPMGLSACALAFKVVSDPRKGVLVYVRVYSGTLRRGDTLHNTTLNVSEKATNLLQMFAGDSTPVQAIGAGQIGVIAGSKFARTGDTLIVLQGGKAKPPEPLSLLQLRPIDVPPPVFFASVEPRSLREEREVHEKLGLLLREDPSLRVTQDHDTGQTLLSGMGELHLEIAFDRLVNYMGAKASMGKITIGYREVLNGVSESKTKLYDRDRSEARGKAGCTSFVEPLSQIAEQDESVQHHAFHIQAQDGNRIVVMAPSLDADGTPSTEENSLPPHLTWIDIRDAYLNGASAALSRGPKRSYPMTETKVTLLLNPSLHLFASDSTISALTSAARLATVTAMKEAYDRDGITLMEPVMNVDITVDESSLGNVAQDISSSRGGQIVSLGDEEVSHENGAGQGIVVDPLKVYCPKDPYESDSSSYANEFSEVAFRTIKAKVPLKEMVGYLKHLRSLSGGRGTFVMTVDRFVKMTGQREKQLLIELQGSNT